MESIITSFKKRQRQIIDNFVAGYNCAFDSPNELRLRIVVQDSEVQNEIKLVFHQRDYHSSDENWAVNHVIRVNLLDYRLNDWRPEAVVIRLKQLIWEGHNGDIKDEGGHQEEDVNYELFSQVEPNAAEPYCVGIRVIGMPEEMPIKSYGQSFAIAFERLTVELNISHFRIKLADKK